jgi:hypothetical protein
MLHADGKGIVKGNVPEHFRWLDLAAECAEDAEVFLILSALSAVNRYRTAQVLYMRGTAVKQELQIRERS